MSYHVGISTECLIFSIVASPRIEGSSVRAHTNSSRGGFSLPMPAGLRVVSWLQPSSLSAAARVHGETAANHA